MWPPLSSSTTVTAIEPGDTAELTRQIQALRHREALHNLAMLYTRAVDDYDLDQVVGMYTEDGVFERRGVAAAGHEAIREAYLGAFSTYRMTLHTLDALVVELAPAEAGALRAVGWAGGHAELVTGRTTVLAAYRYADAYRFLGERWFFEKRSITFMYAVPADEIGGALSGPDRMRWPRTEPAPADYPEGIASWDAMRQSR